GADGAGNFGQGPGLALVVTDRDPGGVMAAVPALAGARDAPEDRHHPRPIGPANKAGAHEGPERQLDRAWRAAAQDAVPELDLPGPQQALVLVARRLRGMEQLPAAIPVSGQ